MYGTVYIIDYMNWCAC